MENKQKTMISNQMMTWCIGIQISNKAPGIKESGGGMQ